MAVPQTSNANDITTVISSLASRQGNRPKAKPISGPKRAAILMLALGEQYGGKVWSLLDDGETVNHSLEPGRKAWLQVVRGEVAVNGEALWAGDGASVERESTLAVTARADGSEILLFDLP